MEEEREKRKQGRGGKREGGREGEREGRSGERERGRDKEDLREGTHLTPPSSRLLQ